MRSRRAMTTAGKYESATGDILPNMAVTQADGGAVAPAASGDRSVWPFGFSIPHMIGTGLFVWCLLSTTVEGFSAFGVDLSRTRQLATVYAVALFVLFLRPWRYWTLPVRWGVGVLAAMIALGFSSWSMRDGSPIAINYWMQWLLPMSCLALALSADPRLLRLWRMIIIGYGIFIAAYQVVGLAFLPPVDVNISWSFYDFRFINAPLALVMLLGMIFAATGRTQRTWIRTVVAAGLGISVVFAQHRTVWAALIVATCLLVVRWVASARRPGLIAGPLVAFGFMLFAAVLPLVSSWSVLPSAEAAPESGVVAAPFRATSTLGWRLEMWTSRMEADRTPLEWVFGGAFGQTPAWGPDSNVMVPVVNSHNMYVDLITMLGIAGVAAFLALLYAAYASRAPRLRSTMIALAACLTFGLFFQWPPVAWLILGLAVGQTRSRPPSPASDGMN